MPLTYSKDSLLTIFAYRSSHRVYLQYKSKHWFTTSFLGGRCLQSGVRFFLLAEPAGRDHVPASCFAASVPSAFPSSAGDSRISQTPRKRLLLVAPPHWLTGRKTSLLLLLSAVVFFFFFFFCCCLLLLLLSSSSSSSSSSSVAVV